MMALETDLWIGHTKFYPDAPRHTFGSGIMSHGSIFTYLFVISKSEYAELHLRDAAGVSAVDAAVAVVPVGPQPSREEQWQKIVVSKSQSELARLKKSKFRGKTVGPPEDQLLFLNLKGKKGSSNVLNHVQLKHSKLPFIKINISNSLLKSL